MLRENISSTANAQVDADVWREVPESRVLPFVHLGSCGAPQAKRRSTMISRWTLIKDVTASGRDA